MNLVTLALRNLQRRAARTAIVSISVGLAVASALSLVALSNSVERGSGEGMDERGGDLVVISRNASDIFSSFVAEDKESKIAAIPGVAEVSGELAMFAPVDKDQQKLVTALSANSYFWTRMPMAKGRAPTATDRRVVVLGVDSSEALHKTVGDTINVYDENFTVIGVTKYQSAINRSMVYMMLPDLQEIAFRLKQVTMFQVKLQPNFTPATVAAVKAEIGKLGSLTASPTDQLLQHDRNLLVMKAISQSVSMIALSMGGLSVLNALLMAVQERTREIGIMMAIGWSKARTMASIVLEGMLIGVAGCAAGIPLSYVICRLFEHIPTIGGILSFEPTIDMILPTLLVSVVLCGLGALYPASRAARMSPADALRRP